MHTVVHPLRPSSPGTRRQVHSLHFGPTDRERKVVIQASLHADEPPGMLVAYHLRRQLEALERSGALQAHVVLVPAANPIGLGQRVLGRTLGRFALAAGENFNRHVPDLSARAAELLLAAHPARYDVAAVRAALRRACAELPVASELDSLRKTLLELAIDADLVIDLHCDNEALLHLYTATPLWPRVEPLARLLGARASLVAADSGDDPFDEACSMVWTRLRARLAQATGVASTLPDACVAVTVELRGETDVTHALAQQDAQALIGYLVHEGFIAGPPPTLPPLLRPASPLAGSMPVIAPQGGVVVFACELGAEVRAGDLVADILDPYSGEIVPVRSPIDGFVFAREIDRCAQAGMSIAKVAGSVPLRSGKLLSA